VITPVLIRCRDCSYDGKILSSQIDVYFNPATARRWIEFYCPECEALCSNGIRPSSAKHLTRLAAQRMKKSLCPLRLMESKPLAPIKPDEVLEFQRAIESNELIEKLIKTAKQEDLMRVDPS
jgi:hypothetical protein